MTEARHNHYLIIGNSAGGIGAAEAIRECDKTSPITIVSDEPYPAYSRPLISEYLATKCPLERMLYRPPDFYEKSGIRLLSGRTAVRIDIKDQTAELEDGAEINWDKLLLATGGSPIVPPIDGRKSTGVFTFTTLADARAIDKFIKKGMRAVVIGGGLIGVSVTEALERRGLKVTIVEMKDRILNTILDETASAIAAETLEKNGVKIITNHTVTEINSEFTTDRIHAVTLDDSRGISCEVVIIAIGVRPRTEIASEAGIRVNRGIVVNRTMMTSHPGIYACGDVVEAYDFIHGENRVTPIWPNAYLGGRVAGFNMAGRPTVYAGGTALNSIKYFGMAITSAGVFAPVDSTGEVVTTKNGEVYRKLILKNGRLSGFIFCGDIERSGIIYGLMRDQVDVAGYKQTLIADEFSYISLPEPVWRERLASTFKPQPVEAETVKVEALR